MARNCEYCGKYSSTYILCRECNDLKKNGKLEKCEDCEMWHKLGESCNCKRPGEKIASFFKDILKPLAAKEEEEPFFLDEDDDDQNESICLICDKPSNGYLFCRECYRKYKNKTILLSITNCEKFKIMKETYTGQYTYTCKDGHIVKSKSERDIDNYFFDNNIRHVYEKEIITDEDITIHPDFYLPDLKVYLEHWGYGKENKAYTAQKQLKMDYYRRSHTTLICTYEASDSQNIEARLEHKLRRFKHGEINFEE